MYFIKAIKINVAPVYDFLAQTKAMVKKKWLTLRRHCQSVAMLFLPYFELLTLYYIFVIIGNGIPEMTPQAKEQMKVIKKFQFIDFGHFLKGNDENDIFSIYGVCIFNILRNSGICPCQRAGSKCAVFPFIFLSLFHPIKISFKYNGMQQSQLLVRNLPYRFYRVRCDIFRVFASDDDQVIIFASAPNSMKVGECSLKAFITCCFMACYSEQLSKF